MFKLGYSSKRPFVLEQYTKFIESQWLTREQLIHYQEEKLRKLIHFVYDNVPYYQLLFKDLNLIPDDIKKISDLCKIPVLTKYEIKQNWEKFIPNNLDTIKYHIGSTGGSTGEPLKYRISETDYETGVALTLRGWGYAGYTLGAKLSVIAGTSLIPSEKNLIKEKIKSFLMNMNFYSSYGMNDEMLLRIIKKFSNSEPAFIRGYASSVYILAKFILENGMHLNFTPDAIFTTSEMLLPFQRVIIEKAFCTSVFDGYGLNDSGISAYECDEHSGLHIDMERAILEVVDDKGNPVSGKEGKIVATSLLNFAQPFIRYETGDIGILSDSICKCGRETPKLIKLVGRTTDYLNIDGKKIGSPVLTVLMGKFDIEQYQIIQEKEDYIVIKIVKGKNFNIESEKYIVNSLKSYVKSINISFEYVSKIINNDNKKHKFIINNVKRIK